MAAQTLLSTATVKQLDDFSEPFTLLKPRNYPTATLAQFMKGKPPIQIKKEWGEKALLQRATQINNGAGYAPDATTLVFDSTDGIQATMDVMIYRTKEIITIGAVDSTTQVSTCTRGARGTTAAAIIDNDKVLILGIPRAEGYAYSSVTPRMVLAADLYNYLQIFVEHVGITNTEQVIQARGGVPYGDDYQAQIDEAMDRIKAAFNRALLLGILSGSGLTRTMGGLLQYAGQQNWTAGDITNRATFESTFKDVLINSDGDLMVPCSYTALQAFQYLYQAGNIMSVQDVVRIVGIKVTKVETFMGAILNLYYEPALEDSINASGALVGTCGVYPKSAVKIHDNRTIGRYEVPPSTDGKTEGILLETTASFKGALALGMFGGITQPS